MTGPIKILKKMEKHTIKYTVLKTEVFYASDKKFKLIRPTT